MKKHIVRFVLGAACVLFFFGHVVQRWQIPFISVVDAYLYDVRVRLSAPNTINDQIVIVDIDEKSLAKLGRWPWGRNTLATLVRRLTTEYKVAVLGFDVVFAEPDDSSGLKVLESVARDRLRGDEAFQGVFQDLRHSLDYDQQFAEALKGRPVVLGYYFSDAQNASRSGALPAPLFPPGYFEKRPIDFTKWIGYGANLPLFQHVAAGAGHFNPLIDFDGVARRVPLIVEYGGAYYESLSLAMIRTLFGGAELRPGYPGNGSGMEWLDLKTAAGTKRIPVDDAVAALVPYRGQQRSFPYISAVDVIKGKADASQLKGKIVLVGTTAPGLLDQRATPVESIYPGVEIHANLIAGILEGNVKEKPSYVLGAEAVQLILFGGMLSLLLPLLSPLRASLLTGMTLATVTGLNLLLWDSANLVLPLASSLLLILLLYVLNMSWGYFSETRIKHQLTGLFGQYVPPELVDEMARDPERYSMEGRKEDLTVLFSDVRGFTSISEKLDPKELARLMNEYLGPMTATVRRNRGTLDKYIGDAIMAFWGAPVADAQHARHAVLAALEMQREVVKLAEPFRARGWPELHIGVGINSGAMTVGNMGSPVRQAYTVMGDAVNLASRLEGVTKEYGVGIVVGEAARRLIDDIVFREIDRIKVQGKDEPVAVYEPVGLFGEIPPAIMDEIKLWHHALRLYRLQDWEQAELHLYNLLSLVPGCRLYKLYAERVAYFRSNPPGENWDGVTAMKTK